MYAQDIGASDLTEPLYLDPNSLEIVWVMSMVEAPGDPPKVERCVALDGAIGGPCSCAIYDERPAVCRQFERGSRDCQRARERW